MRKVVFGVLLSVPWIVVIPALAMADVKHREVLQVVGAAVAVAGVVRRHAVVAKVDPERIVPVDGVRRQPVARPGPDVDAPAGVERDDVAFVRTRAADRVVAGKPVADEDAVRRRCRSRADRRACRWRCSERRSPSRRSRRGRRRSGRCRRRCCARPPPDLRRRCSAPGRCRCRRGRWG